ncbi:MAG: hypothetical protein BKP49_01175 [Treponema sp. CETP13]|nr:MAG: hypothetical protein BKP49_01175 [Treponema sp. CETP13]
MNKIISKKHNLIFLCLCFFLCQVILFSCDGTQKAFTLPAEKETVKYAALSRNQSCIWIDDIDTESINVAREANETSEKIMDSAKNIGFSNYLNSEDSNAPKIYPSILGFGSLDSSNIPEELYDQVKIFILCINSGDFSKVEVSNQKDYLRAFAKYKLVKCKPVSKSYIGKSETVTINIDANTTKDLQKVPILIETTSQKYIVVTYYELTDNNEWKFNRFEVYDE